MSKIKPWQPSASLSTLQQRAHLLSTLRAFFAERGVLEVETPLMQTHTVTDPHIDSFTVTSPSGPPHYLQTSPEYAMKRLLCAYPTQSLFQIAKAFRVDETGRWHQNEFTLLEWYRIGMDHHQLIAEMQALLLCLLPDLPQAKQSYQACFLQHTGMDPLTATTEKLRAYAACHIPHLITQNLDKDDLLQCILSHCIEPQLKNQAIWIYDFPASQAALARLNPDKQSAARFELYLDGIECANGFFELNQPLEQRQRFEADNRKRIALGKTPIPLDESLLHALEQGLPDCAGVALGIDRLLAVMAKQQGIGHAMAFAENAT